MPRAEADAAARGDGALEADARGRGGGGCMGPTPAARGTWSPTGRMTMHPAWARGREERKGRPLARSRVRKACCYGFTSLPG